VSAPITDLKEQLHGLFRAGTQQSIINDFKEKVNKQKRAVGLEGGNKSRSGAKWGANSSRLSWQNCLLTKNHVEPILLLQSTLTFRKKVGLFTNRVANQTAIKAAIIPNRSLIK